MHKNEPYECHTVVDGGTAAEARAEPDRQDEGTECWRSLGTVERLIGVATIATVAIVAWPHLPPGICFGDSGELQLVAATLGITHAPGYPLLATLGHLVTYVPGVDPAYMVSVASLLSGLVVLWLCYLLQVRLGVRAGIAGMLTLAMAAHPRMWINLIAPEVYAPTLAMLAGAVYLLIKHTRLGRRRDLHLAAILLGAAIATRPPVLLSVPFVIAVWWITRRIQGERSWRHAVRSLGLCTLLAMLPGCYALGYLYVRDAPETVYDYIELHDREYDMVPDLDEGPIAKIKRVFWLASAREFDYAIGNDAKGVWNKLRWFRREFFLYQPGALLLTTLLIAVGVVATFRRDAPCGILLAGVIISNLVFLCAYRMWGQAADYLPFLWAAIIFLGVSTTVLRRGRREWLIRQSGLLAWAVMGALTVSGAFRGPDAELAGDAVPFLQKLDLTSLPPGSVICVAWPETPAVFYARYVVSPREDIDLLSAAVRNWERLLEQYDRDRPIFGASFNPMLTRWHAVPFRNIWRLVPRTTGRAAESAPARDQSFRTPPPD